MLIFWLFLKQFDLNKTVVGKNSTFQFLVFQFFSISSIQWINHMFLSIFSIFFKSFSSSFNNRKIMQNPTILSYFQLKELFIQGRGYSRMQRGSIICKCNAICKQGPLCKHILPAINATSLSLLRLDAGFELQNNTDKIS